MTQQGTLFPDFANGGDAPLTAEQQNVIWGMEGDEHLKVIAYAGSGKTRTLVGAAEARSDKRFVCVVFGRDAAKEGKARFPANADCRTAHSLAFKATVGRFGTRATPPAGFMAVVRALEDHPLIESLADLYDGDSRAAAMVATRALTRYAQSADRRPTPKHVPFEAALRFDERERTEVLKTAAEVAAGAWDRMVEKGSPIPITFDVYLKYWALTGPQIPCDIVMHDEAQDANPVMLQLLTGQSAQQVYVGDPCQQIYAFRGAVDAMKKVPGREFALTGSFRFGEAIAGWANEVLEMLGENRRINGVGPPGEVLDDPLDPRADATLCRGNAGVVHEALAGLAAGRRVAVVKVEDAVRLLEAAYELWRGRTPRHPEIGVFIDWTEFELFAGTKEGASYIPIVRLVLSYRGGVPELCRKLRDETVSEGRADLVVSTAHRAKGRQWRAVRLSDDFPRLVEEDADGNVVFRRDEAHLIYVAITRAMRRLNLAGYGRQLRADAETLRTAES